MAIKLLRPIARCRIMVALLSEFRWFRKLHGGRWEQWHVDYPVCSCLWMDIPHGAPNDYREGLWRGTPYREVWP